ncbi:PTS mannitol transporter subunit IICBA, partial [Vibrio sp. 10N.286.49.E1]
TNVMFDSGLISPASPGSIFAVLLMTPKGSYIGVVLSVIAATAVSFVVASILLKTSAQGDDEDSLEKASAQMKDMKASSKGAASEANVNLADVKA